MNHHKETKEPALTPIKNGWAAHGDGWASDLMQNSPIKMDINE